MALPPIRKRYQYFAETPILVGDIPSARVEARNLYAVIRRGQETVQSVRELIAIPLQVEAVLKSFAVAFPAEAWWIRRVVKYRRAVGEEFERLADPRPAGKYGGPRR
jgi:hypothetical protein